MEEEVSGKQEDKLEEERTRDTGKLKKKGKIKE